MTHRGAKLQELLLGRIGGSEPTHEGLRSAQLHELLFGKGSCCRAHLRTRGVCVVTHRCREEVQQYTLYLGQCRDSEQHTRSKKVSMARSAPEGTVGTAKQTHVRPRVLSGMDCHCRRGGGSEQTQGTKGASEGGTAPEGGRGREETRTGG